MGLSAAQRQEVYRARKQAEREAMLPIPCGCGCGTLIPPINKQGRPARFAHGHNQQAHRWQTGQPAWNKGLPAPWASVAHSGKKLSPEQLELRKATRLDRLGGIYQIKRGWKHSPETIERMKAANQSNAKHGKDNPFYGRKHTLEARQKMGHSPGEGHPHWAGGVSSLPYGPEFTRRYKRLIRERDNHTCQRCGKTAEQEGRCLEVHHIDHNKTNNDPANLTTTCHRCNVWLSYHRDEPARSH